MSVFDVAGSRMHDCEIAGEKFKVKDMSLALSKDLQEAMQSAQGDDADEFPPELVVRLFKEVLRNEDGEPFKEVQDAKDLERYSPLLISELVYAILEANMFNIARSSVSVKKFTQSGQSVQKSG